MEKFDVYKGIMEGLEDAIAYKRGDTSRCRVTVRAIPPKEYSAADVVRTRKELHMSQRGFASILGVSPRTVEAWEAGRNTPSGSARNLLYLLESDHTLVDRLTDRP